MAGTQQKRSKSTLNAATKEGHADIQRLPEKKKKQLELADAMEHEHGRKREALQKEVRDLESGPTG